MSLSAAASQGSPCLSAQVCQPHLQESSQRFPSSTSCSPHTWWPKMHLDREEKFRLAMASGGTLAFLLSGHGPSCAMIGVDRAPDMKAYYCFESPSAQPPALAQGPHPARQRWAAGAAALLLPAWLPEACGLHSEPLLMSICRHSIYAS